MLDTQSKTLKRSVQKPALWTLEHFGIKYTVEGLKILVRAFGAMIALVLLLVVCPHTARTAEDSSTDPHHRQRDESPSLFVSISGVSEITGRVICFLGCASTMDIAWKINAGVEILNQWGLIGIAGEFGVVPWIPDLGMQGYFKSDAYKAAGVFSISKTREHARDTMYLGGQGRIGSYTIPNEIGEDDIRFTISWGLVVGTMIPPSSRVPGVKVGFELGTGYPFQWTVSLSIGVLFDTESKKVTEDSSQEGM